MQERPPPAIGQGKVKKIMRKPRIFVDSGLSIGQPVRLAEDTARHLAVVLRMPQGGLLDAFDGRGGCYECELSRLENRAVWIRPLIYLEDDREPVLDLELAQGISRGQRMDYTIQKAVELGVGRVIPLITEFSTVRLTGNRAGRRLDHWRKIVVHACEQSGRNTIPVIREPVRLEDWLGSGHERAGLVLDPRAKMRIRDIGPGITGITLVCGPEGGLSNGELDRCVAAGFRPVSLGPRILRTETAATAAIAVCQASWGDM